MGFAKKMRKLLWRIVDDLCSERRKYFVSAGKDFTRKGKIKPQDIFKALLVMEDKALSKELLPYFDHDPDAPTISAFVQARAKIRPEAFEALFDRFASDTTDSKKKHLYKGYRLFAVDGSDSHVPANPADTDSYFANINGKHYNLYHINAMFDLLRQTYTDVIIQKKRTTNERSAFIDMVEKHRFDDIPIIFTADRGYESYNDMAHIIEAGHKFLIRVQDIDSRGIAAGLELPDTYFDECMTLKLTRRSTQEVKEMREKDNRIRHVVTEFDYLPKDYDRSASAQFYYLSFRIVRFKVKDTTEVIMTNLPKEDFSAAEIKKLYGMRWGIETSFRDLKYTIGLNYYHAIKAESILQEIYSRMVLYNFCRLIAGHAKVKPSKKGRKYAYKINFSDAVLIFRDFLKKLVKPGKVIDLIEKYIVPIRSGRDEPRDKKPRREVYSTYRIA